MRIDKFINHVVEVGTDGDRWCSDVREAARRQNSKGRKRHEGANRVVLWLNGQDLDSILPEMEELARTVLS